MHKSIKHFILASVGALFSTIIITCDGQCTDYNAQGYCYELVKTPSTWDDAQSTCESRGGKLAGIYNSDILTDLRLKADIEQYGGDYWVGGRQEDPDNWIGYPQSLWRWVKDCPECGLKTACDGDAGNPLDIAFVIDNSVGVTAAQIKDMAENFILRVIQTLTISNVNVKVAIVRMNDNPSNPTLKLSFNRQQISNSATQTPTSSSPRNFVTVLNILRNDIFGGAENRASAPNVVVFITAGPSSNVLTDIELASKQIKDSGVIVYAVGVDATVRQSELAALSAPPKKLGDKYYMYSSTAEMMNKAASDTIRSKICAFQKLYFSLQSEAIERQGCWADQTNPRDLPNDSAISSLDVRPQTCMDSCNGNNYVFGGTQEGNRCYCGNKFGSYSSASTCTTTCAGDATQRCGGFLANSVYKIGGTFSSWAYSNSQPNNLNNFQWCGTMDTANEGRFDDQNCNMEFDFICEYAEAFCTPQIVNTKIFKMFGKCLEVSSFMDTWYKARMYCLQKGGNLYVMKDESQRTALNSYLFNTLNYKQKLIYIGLSRNRFYWMDETGGTEMVHNYFGPKEPQPTDGLLQMQCVYVKANNASTWYTSNCAQRFNFMCHYKKPALVPPGSSTVSTASVSITPGIEITSTAGPVVVTPSSSSTTEGEGKFPTWAIALLAALAALLLLLLLLCCICCWCGWCNSCCWNRQKVRVGDSLKIADVRPKAPIPQSGAVGRLDDINDNYSITSSTAYML